VESAVKRDLNDPARFPEINHIAEVRKGGGLLPEEYEFIHARRLHACEHFAKYLNPEDVHLDDVPVVGFGGSGGGYRAMLAMLAYCHAMKNSGLWDLVTYAAGVSGSCWAWLHIIHLPMQVDRQC
jgi:phospholipase A2